MTYSEHTKQIEHSVKRLILLAGELRDYLALSDWEQAAGAQDEYDQAFASFKHMIDNGIEIPTVLLSDVEALATIHNENIQLAKQLSVAASHELRKLNTMSRIGSYAPLGSNDPGVASRFVDGAA